MAQIITVRQLRGAAPEVWTRHASGPGGLAAALRAHRVERDDAESGTGWLEVVERGGGPGSGVRLHTDFAGRPPRGGAPLSWWRDEIEAFEAARADFFNETGIEL